MRKTLFLVLMVMLLVAVPIVSAEPVPLDELTAHAEFAPPDSFGFVSIRADDAYFDELDAIIERISSEIPELLPPQADARLIIEQTAGESFMNALETWLGDRISFGFFGLDAMETEQNPPMIFIADITDSNGIVDDFGDDLDDKIETQIGDYTLYVPEPDDFDQTTFLVGETIFIATTLNAEDFLRDVASGDVVTLADQDGFTGSMGLLPADSYNIAAYLDVGALLNMSLAFQSGGFNGEMDTMMPDSMQALADAGGSQAYGLTMIDGRSLTLDFAVAFEEAITSALFGIESMELVSAADFPPIDVEFADYLSADTQFVIHGTALGPQFMSIFDSLSLLGELISQQIDMMMMNGQFPGMVMSGAGLGFDLGGLFQGYNTLMFAGLTGLHLGEDVLSWMTDDYAMFLNVVATEDGLGLSLDAGNIIAVTDVDAASNVFEKLARAAEAYGTTNTTETHGSGKTLILPNLLRQWLELALPEVDFSNVSELDVMVGSSDEIFAVGTRPGVEFALEPTDGSLRESTAFNYAAETLVLPESQVVYYIGIPALTEVLGASDLVREVRGLVEGLIALDLFESATGSTRMIDERSAVGRLALTLTEE